MNKLAYLCLSILEISKTLMQEFWYDYVETKCGEKAESCYMDKYKQQKTFTLILQKIVKQELIVQIMNQRKIKEKIKRYWNNER